MATDDIALNAAVVVRQSTYGEMENDEYETPI
jgi:hypothetical protein